MQFLAGARGVEYFKLTKISSKCYWNNLVSRDFHLIWHNYTSYKIYIIDYILLFVCDWTLKGKKSKTVVLVGKLAAEILKESLAYLIHFKFEYKKVSSNNKFKKNSQ